MFKLAVLGPVITGGFGAARQCVECQRRQSPHQPVQCHGFGAGCLGYAPMNAAAEATGPGAGLARNRLLRLQD